MTIDHVIEADWTWSGLGFRSGVQVTVDESGRIASVGTLGETPTRRMRGVALLPGFVNAHSHAFQRGLRGRGDRFPRGVGTFWTWREAMYELVASLDLESAYRLSLQAFHEMRHAGITTVGEFHYLHHTDGTEDFGLDEPIRRAAQDAGIRLMLLQTYYRTGGINRPLLGGQQRFATPSLERYWEQYDRLAETLDPSRESMGVVAHSIRAAGPEEIDALHDESLRRGAVFHIHVEEQRQEIEECLSAYGERPLALLNRLLPTHQNVTIIHGTHATPDDLNTFLESGGTLCVCPLTEGNLGDGSPNLEPIRGRATQIAIGTDSNMRIDMQEEMRWLELAQRLRLETRGVLRSEDGHLARQLLSAATLGGAAALGLDVGRIAPGAWADFAAVDLMHPSLVGWDGETLLDALVFGAGAEVVLGTAVGGAWSFPGDTGDRPHA